ADAKLCDSLSQAIYAAVLAKKDVAATRALNVAMEEEKQRILRNADMVARGSRNNERRAFGPGRRGEENAGNGRNPQNNGDNSSQNRPGTGTDSLTYRDYERRIEEIDGLKKENMSKGELQILQAKIQYQALMMQFFIQRRFEHVV